MERVNNIQEKINHIGREMEILWKNRKKMTEIKNTVREMKNVLICSSVDWTEPKKKSDCLKVCQ